MFICRNFLLLAKTNVGGILEDIKIAKAFKIVLRVKCVANNYRKKIFICTVVYSKRVFIYDDFTQDVHLLSRPLSFSAFCFSRIDEDCRICDRIRLCSVPHTVGPKMKKNSKFVDCFKLRSSIFLNGVLCLVSIALYILCVVKIHS